MASKQVFPGKRRPAKLSEDALWAYALKLIGRRSYSAHRIQSKLSLRAESPEAVAAAMLKLREYGLADDRKFSEAYATSSLQNSGFGAQRVLRDLYSQRVPGSLAAESVSKVFEGSDERELIENYLARKYRSVDLFQYLKEEKHLASAYRRLRTAGFSSSMTLTVLRKYSHGTADWDEPPED